MSVVPIDFRDDVNDFDVGVNMFFVYLYILYIFLFCMPNDTYECKKVLLNVD